MHELWRHSCVLLLSLPLPYLASLCLSFLICEMGITAIYLRTSLVAQTVHLTMAVKTERENHNMPEQCRAHYESGVGELFLENAG